MFRLRNLTLRMLSMLVVYGLMCPSAFSELPPAPEDLFLQTPKDIQDDVLYSRLRKAKPDSEHLEHLKITYLIARIRGSNYEFIRNDQAHKGARAAQHMQIKYRYAYRHIHSAHEFIENIATRSEKTETFYFVRIPAAGTFYLRDLLLNELRHLEAALQQTADTSSQD